MIVLSLGAGVQSSAMLVLSCLDLHGCPRADAAIFADTQGEPAWVYHQLEMLKKWSTIPIFTVTAGNLAADLTEGHTIGRRVASIPSFTRGGDGIAAPLRRQCTREYKIEPITRKIRDLLQLRSRQRAHTKVDLLLGISLEEAHRMRDSRTPWIRNRYPLIEAGLKRHDCESILRNAGLPVPKKSACVFCPYHSDSYWRDLRKNHPEEWGKALTMDAAIRDVSQTKGWGPQFLHRSLVPLADVRLKGEAQEELFGQECEGICAV